MTHVYTVNMAFYLHGHAQICVPKHQMNYSFMGYLCNRSVVVTAWKPNNLNLTFVIFMFSLELLSIILKVEQVLWPEGP